MFLHSACCVRSCASRECRRGSCRPCCPRGSSSFGGACFVSMSGRVGVLALVHAAPPASDSRVPSGQLPTPSNQERDPSGRHGFRHAPSLEHYAPCKHACAGFTPAHCILWAWLQPPIADALCTQQALLLQEQCLWLANTLCTQKTVAPCCV